MRYLKAIIIGFVFAVLFCGVATASEDRIYIGYGQDFVRTGSVSYWSGDFDEQSYTVGWRHYPETRTFYQVKFLTYKNPNSEYSANYLSLGIGREWFGGRGEGTFFITTVLGYGYLDNPDEHLPKGKLSHHQQFEPMLGIGYNWSKDVSLHLDWDHLSNCKSICNRGQNYTPNVGRDFATIAISKRF